MKVKLPLKLTLTDKDGIVIDSWDSADDMDVLSAVCDEVHGPAQDAIVEAMDNELAVADKRFAAAGRSIGQHRISSHDCRKHSYYTVDESGNRDRDGKHTICGGCGNEVEL